MKVQQEINSVARLSKNAFAKVGNTASSILSIEPLPLILRSFNKKLRQIDGIEVNVSFFIAFFSIKMPSSQFVESSFKNLM